MSDYEIILQSGILQLIVVCLAIIAIVWCFINSKLSEDNRRIHLLYVSGILTFLIIELVSYVCVANDADGKTITSYVSFASTLSSLILSIVAIIFTIVTNQKGDDVLAKIDNTASNIKEAGTQISSAAKTISDKTIQLEKRIANIEQIATDTNVVIKEMSKTSVGKKFTDTGLTIESIVEQVINTGSVLGNAALLACCYSKETGKSFDLKTLFDSSCDYVYGYLVSISTLLFIDIEVQDLRVSVNDVDEHLKEQLQTFFSSMAAEKLEFVKSVQEKFGVKDEFFKADNNE